MANASNGRAPMAYTSEMALAAANTSEIKGVIHHGHEKVRGGDDAGLLVELPHGGFISRVQADQELLVGCGRRLMRKELLQHRWRELAAASPAMGEAGQAKRQTAHPFSLVRTPVRTAGAGRPP
jgi:hypothetical protein